MVFKRNIKIEGEYTNMRSDLYLDDPKCMEVIGKKILKDEDAQKVQSRLASLRYGSMRKGLFYQKIKEFQKQNGLLTDGLLGKLTLRAMGYSDEEIESLMKVYCSYYKISIKNEYLKTFYENVKMLLGIGE